MNIFLTGGAGFVGTAVIHALLARNHSIHALVNHRPLKGTDERIKSFHGELFDNAALDRALAGCDAVIHLVGIIAEKPAEGITFDRIHYQGTKQVVDATGRARITRYLQMSALGADPNAAAMYHLTKFKAEQYVRSSSLDWTIFQPSMIHGPGGDFSKMEAAWARGTSLPYLFMPYFGAGLLGTGRKFQVQPIFVDDVARAFAEALEKPPTIHEVIPVGGADKLTWPQMHQITADALVGHARRTFAIPAWYARTISRIVPSALLPFTYDQVLMSQQDNVCDLSKFVNLFGWTPKGYAESLSKEPA